VGFRVDSVANFGFSSKAMNKRKTSLNAVVGRGQLIAYWCAISESIGLGLYVIIRLAVDMKFPIHIHIHIHRFCRGYPWKYPWIYPWIYPYTHGLPIASLWLTCKIASTIPQSTTGGRVSYQNDHDAGIPF